VYEFRVHARRILRNRASHFADVTSRCSVALLWDDGRDGASGGIPWGATTVVEAARELTRALSVAVHGTDDALRFMLLPRVQRARRGFPSTPA
jgi:hypothetical protein